MQALPIAPVDLPAATPSAPPAPKTGEDGLFAARLQAATSQQQTNASPNATDRTESVSPGKQIVSGPDTDQRDSTATEETPAASLNSSAGAALQTVSVESQPNPATAQPAAAPGGETAIARMLDVLSKGGGSTLQAAESVVPVKPEANSSVPVQLTDSVAPQNPLSTNVPDTGSSVPNITIAATPLTMSSQDNSFGQPGVGGNIPLSAASLDNGPQPLTTTSPAALSQLPGSAPLIEGRGGPSQAEITITEGAQAPDRTQSGIQATVPVSAQTEETAASSATQAGSPLYVQNKYGQIIAIQQTQNTADEGEADSPATSVATGSSQRLDTNSNYIHSHLPKEMPDKGTEQNSGQAAPSTTKAPQGATAAGEPAQPGQTFAEQAVLQNNRPTTTPDTQPLVFAQPLTNSPTAAGAIPGQSTVYHLASGLMVPEGTVVDQMIAHFAANRRLDTGEVTIRLHPQELGEVRMAIKVEQDNVRAHIIAQNPQAQEMIDRHLPRLREALEQQGLNLHQIEVTVAAHDNAGGERFQDNNAWRQPAASSHRSISEQPIFSVEPDEIMAADTAATNTTLSVLA